MSYGDFDLKTAVRTFGLTNDHRCKLFEGIDHIEPSGFLRSWLGDFAGIALGIGSDKARSVYLVAPMLAEGMRRSGGAVKVLRGVAFDVDPPQGLEGLCDYLIVQSTAVYYVEPPVFVVVEANHEDIVGGLGSYVAQMVAIQLLPRRGSRSGFPARRASRVGLESPTYMRIFFAGVIFNEQEGKPREVVHGCVTSGSIWRFLRLRGKHLQIDVTERYLRQAAEILGILDSIARSEAMRGAWD